MEGQQHAGLPGIQVCLRMGVCACGIGAIGVLVLLGDTCTPEHALSSSLLSPSSASFVCSTLSLIRSPQPEQTHGQIHASHCD